MERPERQARIAVAVDRGETLREDLQTLGISRIAGVEPLHHRQRRDRTARLSGCSRNG